jgi:hypothetical protein
MRFSSAEDKAGAFTLLNIACEDAMDSIACEDAMDSAGSAKRTGRGHPLRLPLAKGSIYTTKTH